MGKFDFSPGLSDHHEIIADLNNFVIKLSIKPAPKEVISEKAGEEKTTVV